MAHTVAAVFFQFGEAREPIDRFRIPRRRWEMVRRAFVGQSELD